MGVDVMVAHGIVAPGVSVRIRSLTPKKYKGGNGNENSNNQAGSKWFRGDGWML